MDININTNTVPEPSLENKLWDLEQSYKSLEMSYEDLDDRKSDRIRKLKKELKRVYKHINKAYKQRNKADERVKQLKKILKPVPGKYTKVRIPLFEVGNNQLNEYELRQLQLEVVRGEKPANILVTDLTTGVTTYIHRNGSLGETLEGMNTAANLQIELIREKNKQFNK